MILGSMYKNCDYERLHRFDVELKRLSAGSFSSDEQFVHDNYREITAADAIGFHTNLQYHLDVHGDFLGISLDCQNNFGQFSVNTVDRYISAGKFKVTLDEDICDEINTAFEEIRDF